AFLLSSEFVQLVSERCSQKGITFDSATFVAATRTLVASFRRYHSACRSLRGVRVSRGIPIGCLTSKLIANVALAPLDDHVRAQPGVEYYARYVDDILLVAK